MTPAGQSRTIVSLGVAQTLAWGSTYYLPAILAVPMARDLGLSTGTVFGGFSAALIVAAFVGPAAGKHIDLRGGRGMLAVSNGIFATGLIMMGLAEGAVLLTAAWLVIGAGMAMGLYEAAFATLAGIYGRSARGPITGITLLAGFASTVCWPISAYLEAEIGWRATCFAWAGVHLLVCLPLNRFLVPPGTQPVEAHETAGAAPGAAKDDGGKTLALWVLAFVFAVTWFTSTAMAAHLPRLLLDAGATPTMAVAAASLVGPAQVAARILEYTLLRRLHPLLSARLAAIAHPIGAAGLLLMGAPTAVFFTLMHGAGNGILTIAKGTLPLAIFGPAGYGLRQGLLMIPARFGQAAAPFVFAVLIDRYGGGALLASSALGIAAFAALFLIGPVAKSKEAPP